jgi:hypothetical protein
MQLIPVFTLLPLLAMVASVSAGKPPAGYDVATPAVQVPASAVQTYGQPADNGGYSDRGYLPDTDGGNEDEDERTYEREPDHEPEEEHYKEDHSKTVIIVVAKTGSTTTTTTAGSRPAKFVDTSASPASGAFDESHHDSAPATAADDEPHRDTKAHNYGHDHQEEEKEEAQPADERKVLYEPPHFVNPHHGLTLRPVANAAEARSIAVPSNFFAVNKIFALRINNRENKRRHRRRFRVFPNQTKCLAVEPRGVHKRMRAVMRKCSDEQRFWSRSKFSLQAEHVGADRIRIVWYSPTGAKMCARHDVTGTRFYACDSTKRHENPTEYIIGVTRIPGKVKIRQADRNRCFDGRHHTLWMNRCRGVRHQAWDVLDIAYF